MVHKLDPQQLLVERARYVAALQQATDLDARRAAEARIREIDAELARRNGKANGTATKAARWSGIDLVTLIVESGCTLTETANGKLVGDHGNKHHSKSGRCLVVWPDEGRWWCSSCRQGGDAAAWIADVEGISYRDAAKRLRQATEDDAPRQSQADVLAEIGGNAELFCDPRGNTYARVAVGDHHEVWPVRSKAFKRWLVGQYYARTQGKAPNAEAVGAALLVLEARAQFEGTLRPVYLRVAPDGQGGIYVDLGDASWQAVHVTASGWRVVENPPVCFRRSPGMQALPVPEPGGSLDELRAFVNVPDDDAWALLKAWLVAALFPGGPYPVLAIRGEQGSAKSTLARMLRALVDPATPELRSDPRELRDLAIAAEHCWTLVFDNVSRVQPWLSDALCRLSTGGGWATRELWTDLDEILFEAIRPVILNGITEYITEGDLLDRAIQINLPPIPADRRRAEAEVWPAFDAARPRTFGALLDRLVGALRERANVKLERLPRMADFAVLGVAAERGRSEEARFLNAYTGVRAEADVQAVEASLIGAALLGWLKHVDLPWEGTAADLLTVLAERAGDQVTRRQGWPKTPRGLRSELNRLAPALRRLGWSLTFDRAGHGGQRQVRIEYSGAEPSPSSPSSPTPEELRASETALEDDRG